jgi:hypothetical protein
MVTLRSRQKPRFLPAATELMSEKAPQATFSNRLWDWLVGINRESKAVFPGALFALNHLALSPLL